VAGVQSFNLVSKAAPWQHKHGRRRQNNGTGACRISPAVAGASTRRAGAVQVEGGGELGTGMRSLTASSGTKLELGAVARRRTKWRPSWPD
jgi:hypothetical protein